MKTLTENIVKILLCLGIFFLLPATNTEAQDGKNLSPKQQIDEFYALCKQDRSADALKKALSVSEMVKPEDSEKVAAAFANMVKGMGEFLDFEIIREFSITKRTVVIRCVAHYTRQPFVNEFTYYNPEAGGWRMVHLRYDANPATMFTAELAGK